MKSIELTLVELGVLILTNDGEVSSNGNRHEVITLTTKESYIWAAVVAKIIEDRNEIEVDEVVTALSRVIQDLRGRLRSYYDPQDVSALRRGDSYSVAEWIIEDLSRRLNVQLNPAQLLNKAFETYQQLMEKELIEDPVVTGVGVLSVALLGFVPFGFTRKKRNGKVVYRRINAAFWKYEEKVQRGNTVTNLHFKLWKILNAVKDIIVEDSEDSFDD